MPPSSPEDRERDLQSLIGRARAAVGEKEDAKRESLGKARSQAARGKKRSQWYLRRGYRMVKP